jgi:hypothetical protein
MYLGTVVVIKIFGQISILIFYKFQPKINIIKFIRLYIMAINFVF